MAEPSDNNQRRGPASFTPGLVPGGRIPVGLSGLSPEEPAATTESVIVDSDEFEQRVREKYGIPSPTSLEDRPVVDFSTVDPEEYEARVRKYIESQGSVDVPKEAFRGASRGVLEGLLSSAAIVGGVKAGAVAAPFTGPAAPFMPILGGVAGFGLSLIGASAAEPVFEEMGLGSPENPNALPVYEGARTAGGVLGGAPAAFGLGSKAFQVAANPTIARGLSNVIGPERTSSLLLSSNLASQTGRAGTFNQLVGQIGDFARAHPGGYLGVEALRGAWVGTVGGSLVGLLPPEEYPVLSPVVRFGGETMAGAFNMPTFASNLAMSAGRLTPQAEQRAASALQEYVRSKGLDPKTLAAEITAAMENLPIDPATNQAVRTSTAQLFDNAALTALDRELALRNSQYSSDTEEMGLNAKRVFRTVLEHMQRSGDPELTRKAVQLREDHIQADLNAAIESAQYNAAMKAATLTPKAAARGELDEGALDEGRAIDTHASLLIDELGKVIQVARATESQLWNKATSTNYRSLKTGRIVPVKLKPSNLLVRYLDSISNVSPNKAFDEEALKKADNVIRSLVGGQAIRQGKKAVSRTVLSAAYQQELQTGARPTIPTSVLDEVYVGKDGKPQTVNLRASNAIELVNIRKLFLSEARALASQGKDNEARVYNELAAAALDDLDTISAPEYAEARAFSRTFNDVFTRTFAGELDNVEKTGRLAITPEELVKKMRGSQDDVYLMNKEITQASNYAFELANAGASIRPERSARTIKESQQNLLRAFANETREIGDDGRGLIDINKFNAFREKYGPVINMLGMSDEFRSIGAAQRSLLDLQAGAAERSLLNQKVLSSLLEDENPRKTVAQILRSKSPSAELNRVVETISASPIDDVSRNAARAGLSDMFLDYALDAATTIKPGGATAFNVQKYRDVLFSPINPTSKDKTSVSTLLARYGLIPREQLDRMNRMLDVSDNIDRVTTAKVTAGEDALPTNNLSVIEELAYARVVGTVASAVSPGGAGSLSTASRVFRRAEQMFHRMPLNQQMRVIREAAKDPLLFAAMMNKDLPPDQKRNAFGAAIMRSFNNPTAVRQYVIAPTEEELEEYRKFKENRQFISPPLSAAPARDVMRSLPPAPSTRGNVPGMAPMQGGGAAPAPAPAPAMGGAPQASTSRLMLQQLFPNDAIMGAAALQTALPS